VVVQRTTSSAADFDVAGRKVTTNGSTVYVGGMATDLATPFIRVEVEGSVDSTGTLVASKVQFEHSATVRIRAQVDAIDTTMTPNTLTVLGVKVTVTELTRFEDRSMDHVVTFSLTDLKKGDWIEVRGMESPAGSNQLTANRIERLQTQSMVELGGPVKSEATPQFTILAVPVNTTSSTVFTDAMGSAPGTGPRSPLSRPRSATNRRTETRTPGSGSPRATRTRRRDRAA
jgi:Domain of unknown function (DUF5666)